MAVSIGGVLFEVGMNTNGYQAGAKRIEQIDMNLKNAIKRNHFETAQMAKELHKISLSSLVARVVICQLPFLRQ